MVRSVLCVCRGNTCRSPMLEALLQKERDRRNLTIRVESAGTYVDVDPSVVGSPATDHSVTCMKQRGLNLDAHKSRRIDDLELNALDLIICMTSAEAEEVLRRKPRGAILLANAASGEVPNPFKQGLDKYEECALVLERVAKEVAEIYF